MKATVQYDDFIGTAAADISDHFDLDKFLDERGVDTERYQAIGAHFYHGYADSFFASIICLDKEKSTEEKPYITNISFEAEFSSETFFNLFKRFSVEITKKHNGYRELDINEQVTFDDRPQEEN
jgi:hypothetical protein